MSTTTSLHYLKTARASRLDSGTVNFQLGDGGGNQVQVFLHTCEQADALIRAAVAAKDLLIAAQKPAATHCPVCGAPLTPVEGTCPQCQPPEVHAPACMAPGQCTCGATVDAAGHVTPAGAS